MKARILLILAFWFAFIVNLSSQSTNSIASQFPGPDVATKVANAQNACYPSSGSVPCIIVIDASLSSYPTGSLPVKCANCSWLDYRSGPPSGSGAVIHAENFAGATASERIIACLAAAGNGTCDATGLTGAQTMDATVEIGQLCSVYGQTTALAQTLLLSPSTTFQPTTAGLTMFQVDCNGQAVGLHISIPAALNYTGKAVQVVDTITNQNINTFSLDGLSIDAGTYFAGGYGLYLAPPSGGWIQLVNLRNIRIQGLANSMVLKSTGAGGYVNGNNFSDIMLEGNGTLLTLNAAAGSLQIDGNTFANLQTDGGGVGISLTGSAPIQGNVFAPLKIWDTKTPVSNTNTAATGNLFIGSSDYTVRDPESGSNVYPYQNQYLVHTNGALGGNFASYNTLFVTSSPVWNTAHNAGAVGWNFTAGQGETDYFQNVYIGGLTHSWYAANSANTGWTYQGGWDFADDWKNAKGVVIPGTAKGNTGNSAGYVELAISGTTGSIGGSALTAGTCATGTATIAGGTAGHPAIAAPSDGSFLGGAFTVMATTTNATTVTVNVCTTLPAGGTPAAKTYNVVTF